MSSLFNYPTERRYAQYPRRYLVEYHVRAHVKEPSGKGACATLASAKTGAAKSILHGFCAAARVFDRLTGQYVNTFKGSKAGITIHEGYVK